MTDQKQNNEKLSHAYDAMLGRVREGLGDARQSLAPAWAETLATAREKAVELGELTREEAHKLSEYLERDVQDAAKFIADTGQEFKDWFAFDWKLIEHKLYDALASVADRTSVQLSQLAKQAHEAGKLHSEEITGPGSLTCVNCGAEMHFMHTHAIPPCPQCHKTEFRRWRKEAT